MSKTDQVIEAKLLKGRYRRLKAGLIALALIAVLLVSPFVLVRYAPVREWMLADGARQLGLDGEVHLSIGAIERFDPTGFAFSEVAFSVTDSSGTYRPVIETDFLAAHWSLLNLLRWRLAISQLSVGTITLHQDALALLEREKSQSPHPDLPTADGLPGRYPLINVSRLNLGPFLVQNGDSLEVECGLSIRDLVSSGDEVTFNIDRGWGLISGLSLSLLLEGGEVYWHRDGYGELRQIQLASHDVTGRLNASYNRSSEKPLSAKIEMDRFDPVLVARHYLPEVTLLQSDSLRGTTSFTGSFDDFELVFDVGGQILGEELRRGQAQLAAGSGPILARNISIDADAGKVTGTISWDDGHDEGSFDLRWRALDIHTNWLPWLHELPLNERVSGSGAVELFVPDDGAVTVSGSAQLSACRPWQIEMERLDFSGQVIVEEGVYADHLQIQLPGGNVTGQGFWPLNELEADGMFEIDSLSLSALPVEWRQGILGQFDGSGTISGIATDPVFEGSLTGHNLRRGDWSAELLSAGSLLFWPRDFRGSGNIELWRIRNKDREPANLSLRFSRWDRWINMDTDLRLPNGTVHLSGLVDPESQVTVERGLITAPEMDSWYLERPWTLSWLPDSLVADSLCLVTDTSRLAVGGTWNRNTDQINAGLELDDFNLTRLQNFLGSPITLSGTCDLALEANGVLPDPTVEIALGGDSLHIGFVDLGKTDLAMGWTDSSLTVGPVICASDLQRVSISAIPLAVNRSLFSLFGSEPGADGQSTPGWHALAQAPWEGSIEIDRLNLSKWGPALGLEDGRADGTLRNIEVTRKVGGRDVPIHVVAPWDLRPASAGTGGLSGILRGRIDLGGSPLNPRLRLAGVSEMIQLAGYPIGTLKMDMGYADSVVTTSQLSLTVEDEISWLHGVYPFAISFLPFEAGVLEAPVSMTAELSNLNLALLSGFTKYLPDAQGGLRGRLVIAGTGSDPNLNGNLRLLAAGCRIPGRSERIYNVTGSATVSKDGIEISECQGETGPRGRLFANGKVEWDGTFELFGHGEDIPVFEQGQYDFLVSVDSVHAWREPTRPGEEPPLPRLTGSVEMLQGILTPDLSGGSGATKLLPWEIDLSLSVPGNVQVSQSNAKVRIGEGALNLAYRQPYWNISGSLDIVDGNYRLFNNNFIVRDGTLEFRDTGVGPDITVAINGETFVVTSQLNNTTETNESNPETVTIEVNVQGKPEELQVSLSSVPPLSPEEIVELLSYGRFINDQGNFAAASQTQTILFNTLVEQVESNLTEQFPLFAHVAIEPGVSGDGTRVSVRPVITPAFTGNYTQELSLDPAWELSLYYRLSRMLYLRAGVARDREGTTGYNDEYSLDLKCRFEY
jgi:TamB, inner membrane protein subunit of TAM complex